MTSTRIHRREDRSRTTAQPITGWVVILLLAVGCSGCSRTTLDLGGGSRSVYVPVDRLPSGVDFQYVPAPQQSGFELRARAHWAFWVIPLNHPDWEALLREKVKDSEAVGNLVIEMRVRTADVVVGVLTLGFYRTAQVVIRGDRVRLTAVPPAPPREVRKPMQEPEP